MTITSERLRELRLKKDLSQADVAKLLGISRTAYVKYENGQTKPVRKIKELCSLFNVSSDYILGNDPLLNSTNTKALLQGNQEVLSNEEKSIIEKYRQLDDRGKRRILRAVNDEYDDMIEDKGIASKNA